MDRYRTRKTSRKRPATLDGFVHAHPAGHRKPGIHKAPPRITPNLSLKTTNRPALGNFSQTDGLHTIGQGTLGFEKSRTGASQPLKPAELSAQAPVIGREPIRDKKGHIKLGFRKKRNPKDSDKAKLKSKRNWKKIIKRSALGLAVLIVLGGGFLAVKTYLQGRKILAGGGGAASLQENVDPSLLKVEGDGRINILMLGKGGDGHTAPDLTDTILIASIDPVNKEAGIVSIPRDTYVKTPTSGSMKINAVYSTAKSKVLKGKKIDNQKQKAEEAGLDAIQDISEEILGIPIHYRSMIDFEGFKQAIDAVGGVELQVTTPLYEVMSLEGKRYVLDVKVGTQKFDGFRALAYSRSRHTSKRGDFDRAERQRALLVALKTKVLSLGTLSNPIKINGLLDALGNHVQTNFTLDELTQLYDIGKNIDGNKVVSIGLADPPNNFLITGNISGQSVVLPRAGLNNYKDIQNYIRNTLRDSYLKKENANVLVLNGTSTAGLATKTSDQLKSFGYSVLPNADAPSKNYTDTIIVDMRDGANKYTKHYLEQRFQTSVTKKLPDDKIDPGTADFVIILGTNEKTRLGL